MHKPLFKVLPGLYSNGPKPIDYGPGFREGIILEFYPDNAPSWTGNFLGNLGHYTDVLYHPNQTDWIVITGGEALVLNPYNHQVQQTWGTIETALMLDDPYRVVISNGLWFECMSQEGLLWQSERISWDGMRNIQLIPPIIQGEAYCPYEQSDPWQPFSVNIETGQHTGGSYQL